MEDCSRWLNCIAEEGDEWWKTIITADESRIDCYDPKIEQQSSAKKAIVITFFDYRGILYTRTIEQYRTGTASYYMSVLKQLMKDYMPKKRPNLVGFWKLHRENARAHITNCNKSSC